MNAKEKYIELCKQEQMPLFLQPWWLDAVTIPDRKRWEVMLKYGKQGQIEAAMPYMLRHKMGLSYILMPQQTQIGGVWLSSKLKNDSQTQTKIAKWVTDSLQQLGIDYYYQHYPLYSPLPRLLQEEGFTIKKRITYRIEDTSDIDNIIRSFSNNKKRQIKKSASLVVDYHLTAQEFYQMHVTCLKNKHHSIRYSWNLFENIYKASATHGQGQLIGLRQVADSRLIAAAFIVWDSEQMYYLIPALDPSFGHIGAGARLVLECIKLAEQKGLSFDFEGSNVPSIANHYRQFGSTPVEYYSVEKKQNPIFSLLLFYNKIKEKLQGK